jgi:NADH-quinone oxidoreductase subunit C
VSAPELLALAESVTGVVLDESFGTVTIDVPAAHWQDVATAVRDDPRSACNFFDWLSAYDDGDSGLAVVVHAWSTSTHQSVVLRTHVGRDGGRLATLTPVWPGADWHERETFEMFGVEFTGFDDGTGLGLRPLLLPEGFVGTPLRKSFVLAARASKPWPGAKEPGESDAHPGAPGRRKLLPPGVPAATWGPRPPGGPSEPADE